MSYHERNAKKRKTAHNGPDKSSFKPSASFEPKQGGRSWTVSVAIASSILTNLATADQRMTVAGRIARALAVFSIDEAIIFDDSPRTSRPTVPTDPNSYTGDTDAAHFLEHILSFLEAPPFMRKALFPLHPNLRLTALLPSLDMPHHPHPKQSLAYCEGVVVAGRPSSGTGSVVEVGGDAPVELAETLQPKTRVTLWFDQDERPQAVDPAAPRTEGGYYWGYNVRRCGSLSAVFTESPYKDGYDLSIGTSERGVPASQAFPSSMARPIDFQHLLVVFGGPRGLEFASMNDEELAGRDVQGPRTRDLFDHWVNVLPNQGSRTIRTEEALLIALSVLRGLWDPA